MAPSRINGDLIPGANVVLTGPASFDRKSQVVGDSGFFQFGGLTPGVPYHLTISAKGFENWVSGPIVLASGQFFGVTEIKLKLEASVSSVTVYSSTEQIAAHQVELEEQQRVLGFIPNFYVVYDAKDAVPMTTRLKFQMALKVSIDPISFLELHLWRESTRQDIRPITRRAPRDMASDSGRTTQTG